MKEIRKREREREISERESRLLKTDNQNPDSFSGWSFNTHYKFSLKETSERKEDRMREKSREKERKKSEERNEHSKKCSP